MKIVIDPTVKCRPTGPTVQCFWGSVRLSKSRPPYGAVETPDRVLIQSFFWVVL